MHVLVLQEIQGTETRLVAVFLSWRAVDQQLDQLPWQKRRDHHYCELGPDHGYRIDGARLYVEKG